MINNVETGRLILVKIIDISIDVNSKHEKSKISSSLKELPCF
jgi:hypothetical protein